MTLEELKKLIADDEGETVEVKETTGQRRDACETLCAFLNKDGGTVVFGVTKKGKLTGQLVSDKTKRELLEVFAKFEPSADIAVDWVDVDATHQAIVCTVPRGNERDEALEVPAAALREALVNAFAHREYGDTRTVYLAVYADRVEIKSPGGFPTSLDLERLYDPPVCDSNPRNPRIARVLYLCKMIETWGRGLGVIARECARAGLPLPVTTVRWGFAVTTFKRPKIDASGSNLDQNLDRADPDPIQIDSYPEGDLARRLLATVRRNPLISRKLLAIELSVSERKIRDSLKILKDSGLVARQGPDHGGIWRISRRVAPNGVLKPGTSEVISKGRTGTAEAINEVIKEAIKNEPGINKPRLVRLVRKSRATVERAIVALVAAGKIEHRGSKKTGGYYAI